MPKTLFENKPMIISVSDVHLGCFDSEPDKFLEFCKELNRLTNQKNLENFKLLLITGDFFDVLNDSFDLLARKPVYKQIYAEFNTLINNDKKIIFLLGNHEISVIKRFSKVKKPFVEELKKALKKHGTAPKFLEYTNFCQIASLETGCYTSTPEWTLKVFDKKRDVKKNKEIDKISLWPCQADKPNRFIFAHGYQFTPILTGISGILFWDYLLKAPEAVKEFLDYQFHKKDINPANSVSDQLTLEKELDAWTPDNAEWKDQVRKNRKKLAKAYKKAKGSEKRRDKLRGVDKWLNWGANKFVTTRNLPVDHLIFGHSHATYQINYRNKRELVNCGTWQNVDEGTYVEYTRDGKITEYLY